MVTLTQSDHQILHLAYNRARRIGLSREDAQDCAQEFRVHLLRQSSPTTDTVAWLTRCAHNYACNYLRGLSRRQNIESRYAASLQSTGNELKHITVYHIAGPRTLTMRKVFWDQLLVALKQFTPEQRRLFFNYHFRQYSMLELASKTGRSAHALQQSLFNIHGRLSKLLLAQGWSNADIRQLFATR